MCAWKRHNESVQLGHAKEIKPNKNSNNKKKGTSTLKLEPEVLEEDLDMKWDA